MRCSTLEELYRAGQPVVVGDTDTKISIFPIPVLLLPVSILRYLPHAHDT